MVDRVYDWIVVVMWSLLGKPVELIIDRINHDYSHKLFISFCFWMAAAMTLAVTVMRVVFDGRNPLLAAGLLPFTIIGHYVVTGLAAMIAIDQGLGEPHDEPVAPLHMTYTKRCVVGLFLFCAWGALIVAYRLVAGGWSWATVEVAHTIVWWGSMFVAATDDGKRKRRSEVAATAPGV